MSETTQGAETPGDLEKTIYDELPGAAQEKAETDLDREARCGCGYLLDTHGGDRALGRPLP